MEWVLSLKFLFLFSRWTFDTSFYCFESSSWWIDWSKSSQGFVLKHEKRQVKMKFWDDQDQHKLWEATSLWLVGPSAVGEDGTLISGCHGVPWLLQQISCFFSHEETCLFWSCCTWLAEKHGRDNPGEEGEADAWFIFQLVMQGKGSQMLPEFPCPSN